MNDTKQNQTKQKKKKQNKTKQNKTKQNKAISASYQEKSNGILNQTLIKRKGTTGIYQNKR